MEQKTLVDKVTKSNRAEYRRLERVVRKNGIYSRDTLAELRAQVQDKTMTTTIDLYSVAVAWVLKTKVNYGNKKLLQTMKQISQLFDDINNGKENIFELQETLLKEDGLKISYEDILNPSGSKEENNESR